MSKKLETENFWEIFLEVANNAFSVYIIYLQMYLRVYFNFLKPITGIIASCYMSEMSHIVIVQKERRFVYKTLLSFYIACGVHTFTLHSNLFFPNTIVFMNLFFVSDEW